MLDGVDKEFSDWLGLALPDNSCLHEQLLGMLRHEPKALQKMHDAAEKVRLSIKDAVHRRISAAVQDFYFESRHQKIA